MQTLPKNVYRERIDFSKIRTTVPIPNLIEIQKKSYERFLQMNRMAAEREDSGLQSVFKSVFPISDFRENSSLEFIEYSIGNWECKCGRLAGLRHLRQPCQGCGATLEADPARRAVGRVPLVRTDEHRPQHRLRRVRQRRRAEAQVRRGGVPGTRHDVRRAAEGHHSAGGLEQGSRQRREDHPRHQGAGGLLRRHPADDRQRDLHHQRHGARHRLAVAPVAGRLLPLRGQGVVRRADHSLPGLLGRVRVRRQEPGLRPHRPEAQVPGHRVSAGARVAHLRGDHPGLPRGGARRDEGVVAPVGGRRAHSSAGGSRGTSRFPVRR